VEVVEILQEKKGLLSIVLRCTRIISTQAAFLWLMQQICVDQLEPIVKYVCKTKMANLR